jgi:catechol 2,3-dioxygenase-like lactoylglutathione lyase family enzyme
VFGLARIGQISVTVHDLDRAVEFYRDRLGMQFLFQVPKMAFFDCGGIRLMLAIPEKPEFDHPTSIIYYRVEDIQYYRVEDIQAAYATLTERGVAFSGSPHCVAKLPDHELWLAFFQDLEGNTLALMSEEPRA